jgi:hypothetical protein
MTSQQELQARVKEFYKFEKQEWVGLLIAIIVTAFIFSFRDWGDEFFDLVVGLTNLFLMLIITALTFTFRISCQKIYALGQGYKVRFKVWNLGLIIALVITFLSFGTLPLVLVGSAVAALMIKQRLGEFRYGFSYLDNAIISFWGILGNLILATLFAVGGFFFPYNYFFSKGLILNLVMAFCSLIPAPQLDGLNIFFGSRNLYYFAIGLVLVIGVILLTGTKIGLILTILIGAVTGIYYILKGSEK